jgi:HAD superfamily phosphoserine phosphatase-like hydrolase
LKGLSKEQIEKHALAFLNDVIEKKLNKPVFDRFISHIENNDIVILNSGGFEPYLSHFSRKYNVNYFFSTRLKFKDNVFTGRIEGKDCLGIEKVRRIQSTDILKNNFLHIYVYSDSVTDIPIFNLATHKIAVLKNSSIPRWCQSNFEIISLC